MILTLNQRLNGIEVVGGGVQSSSDEAADNDAFFAQQVAPAIPTDDVAFVFYKICYDAPDNGGKRSRAVFVLSCPSTAKPRRKMLAATVAGAGLKAALVGHSVTDVSATWSTDHTRVAILDKLVARFA